MEQVIMVLYMFYPKMEEVLNPKFTHYNKQLIYIIKSKELNSQWKMLDIIRKINSYLVLFLLFLIVGCKEKDNDKYEVVFYTNRSEERRVGKECRSRWSP